LALGISWRESYPVSGEAWEFDITSGNISTPTDLTGKIEMTIDYYCEPTL